MVLPIIFGPNYKKFQEAIDLINLGGAQSISDLIELQKAFEYLITHQEAGEISKSYVQQNTGATDEIVKSILEINKAQR